MIGARGLSYFGSTAETVTDRCAGHLALKLSSLPQPLRDDFAGTRRIADDLRREFASGRRVATEAAFDRQRVVVDQHRRQLRRLSGRVVAAVLERYVRRREFMVPVGDYDLTCDRLRCGERASGFSKRKIRR